MSEKLKKLYRRFRYGEPIVIVSGLPRSGTSMAMKMLEAGGMAQVVDNKREADEDNPKGYFEDERVMDLAKTEDKSWIEEARGKAIKIIAFLLKDLPQDHNYKVIFMNRHIEEVLASQAKMLARRGETSDTSDEKMTELYQQDLDRAKFVLKYRPCYEALELHYSDVVKNPMENAKRIHAFLGLPLDVEKMASAVDSNLYRNRAEKEKAAGG